MEQTGKQFHGFMRLPLRIRYIVYKHALVRGKIFVVPSSDQQGNEVENWPYEDRTGAKRQRYQDIEQYRTLFDPRRKYTRKRVAINPISAGLLMGVSKTVQAEAEHIFWAAGNQFIFPPGNFEAPRDLCIGSQLTPLPRLKPVQNVSYSFDMQDVEFPSPLFFEMKLKSKYEADGHHSFSKLSRDEKKEMDHNEKLQSGYRFWRSRCEVINRLSLVKLQIDVEQCYCPMGCCRGVETVFGHLGPFEHGAPEEVEVLSWRNEEERRDILALMTNPDRGGMFEETITFVEKIKAD